jgi:hypothetical protein
MTEWTTELSVGFVPLPPEKEEAYWEAIHWLAEIMFKDFDPLVAEYSDVPPNAEGLHLGEGETAENVD